MAIILGIAILAAVILWSRRQSSVGGMQQKLAKQKRCEWVQVDPTTTRALKEYRCVNCSNTAYGRNENLPASRVCRAP